MLRRDFMRGLAAITLAWSPLARAATVDEPEPDLDQMEVELPPREVVQVLWENVEILDKGIPTIDLRLVRTARMFAPPEGVVIPEDATLDFLDNEALGAEVILVDTPQGLFRPPPRVGRFALRLAKLPL